LKIAVFGTQASQGFLDSAEIFMGKFPEVKVEFMPVQGIDWEEYFSKIITQVAAGNSPDLAFVATEGTQVFAGQGLGHPLDEYVKRDKDDMAEYFADVHPALVESMMYEGSLYELPTDFNAANMYYSKKLFAEAGYEHPAADWTKDDFYNIATAIAKKDAGSPVFGYGWTNRLWGSWMPWIFVNGGNLFSEERAPNGEWLWETFYQGDAAAKGRGGGLRWVDPIANSQENVEALEFMIQLTKEGVAPSIELGGGLSLEGFFTGGTLGMIPAGGFWVAGLNNAGMTKDDFDVQLWPKWKSQRHQFGCAGFAILKLSENKDVAWEWCKHFASKPAMEALFVENNTTPTRRSMMNETRYGSTGPEHWQVFYDTLDKHPDTAPIPAPPEAQAMTTIFTKYTSLAMALEMTPQEALNGMQKDLEDLIARTRA
jgi:ABC-type glycerol-3-phosphate transport system substrate-binding protein